MARLNRRAARLATLTTALLVALPLVPATQAAGGTFAPYATVPIPSEPDAVAIGDVTGDGLADVVATTGYSSDPSVDFKLAVLPQLAGGSLGAPVLYSTAGTYPDRPGSLALGDVTGDGRIDVVVGVRDIGIQLFPQLPDGTLGAPTLTASVDSLRVRLANLDGDSALDAVGIGWGTDTATVFTNQGGSLVATTPIAVPHDGWDDLEAADVSGDGRDDIVVMSGQGLVPNIEVLTQLAGGGFAAPVAASVPGGVLTQGIGVGDVTGDGRADVVASFGGNQPSSGLAVFAQTAGGTLAAAVTYPSADIPEPVEVARRDRGRSRGRGRRPRRVEPRRRLPGHRAAGRSPRSRRTRSRMQATTARTASRSAISRAMARPTRSSPTTTTASSSCATPG